MDTGGPDLTLHLRPPNGYSTTTSLSNTATSTADHDHDAGWQAAELPLFPPAMSQARPFFKGVPVFQARPFPLAGYDQAVERTMPTCSSSGRFKSSLLHPEVAGVGQAYSYRLAPAASWFSPELGMKSAAAQMLLRQHHRYLQEPAAVAADMRNRLVGKRSMRAPRMRWTSSLHARFVRAVELLGGHERATPKSVLELMDVKDLRLAHVKSHLQMYRTIKTADKAAAFSGQSDQGSEEEGQLSNDQNQRRMPGKEGFDNRLQDENDHASANLWSNSSSSSTRMETSSSEVENPGMPLGHCQNNSGYKIAEEKLSATSKCLDHLEPKDLSLDFTLGRPDWCGIQED